MTHLGQPARVTRRRPALGMLTAGAALLATALLLAGCGGSSQQDAGFNPESSVTVSDNTPGANADLTVTTTLPADQPLLRSQIVQLPGGWTIDDAPDGDVAGSGSFQLDAGCDGSEQAFEFELVRQQPPSDTELTAWAAAIPQLIDVLFRVEARSSGGYDVSVTFPWEFSPDVVACTPGAFSFTVKGSSDSGAPVVTNPELDGAYEFQIDIGAQPVGQSSLGRTCVAIGDAVCPTDSAAGRQ